MIQNISRDISSQQTSISTTGRLLAAQENTIHPTKITETSPRGPLVKVDLDHGNLSFMLSSLAVKKAKTSRSNILSFLHLDIACLTLCKVPKLAEFTNERQSEIIPPSESNLNEQVPISPYENKNRTSIWNSRNGLSRILNMGYIAAGRVDKPGGSHHPMDPVPSQSNDPSKRSKGGGVITLVRQDIAHHPYQLYSSIMLQSTGLSVALSDTVCLHIAHSYFHFRSVFRGNISNELYNGIRNLKNCDIILMLGDLDCQDDSITNEGKIRWQQPISFMEEKGAISFSCCRTTYSSHVGTSSPDHSVLFPPRRRNVDFNYELFFDELQSTWNAEEIDFSDHRAITFTCATVGIVEGGSNYDRGRYPPKSLTHDDRERIKVT